MYLEKFYMYIRKSHPTAEDIDFCDAAFKPLKMLVIQCLNACM